MSKSFGTRDVMDLTFIPITGENKGKPVLTLDYCKVTSLSTTSEVAEARGGRGNNVIMSWNYGRTAEFSITHAVISDEMLEVLIGNAAVDGGEFELYPVVVTAATQNSFTLQRQPNDATSVKVYNLSGGDPITVGGTYDSNTKIFTLSEDVLNVGGKYLVVYPIDISKTFTISADKYPGYYEVIGTYFARDDVTGEDHEMVLYIPKARINGNFSIELDAEGEPSTFEMTLSIEKVENGDMVSITRLEQ